MNPQASSLDSVVASHVSDLKEIINLSDQVFIGLNLELLSLADRNEESIASKTGISDEEINNLRNNLSILKSVSQEFFVVNDDIQKKKTEIECFILSEYYTAFLVSYLHEMRKKSIFYRICNKFIGSNFIEDMDLFIEVIQAFSNTFSGLIDKAKHVFEACKIFISLSKDWRGFPQAIRVNENIFSIAKVISSISNVSQFIAIRRMKFTRYSDISSKFKCFEEIFIRIALKYEQLSASLVKKDFESLAARVVDDFSSINDYVLDFSDTYESIILSGTLLDSTELQNIVSNLIDYADNIEGLSGFVADIQTCIDPNQPVGKTFNEYLYVASNSNLDDTLIDELTQTILRPSKAFYASDTRRLKVNSYFSIVGPSYMGKTQFAFLLARISPVFYVNLLSNSQTSQIIYEPFSFISHQFNTILVSDICDLEKSSNSLNSSNLVENLDFKFKTVGFIWALLEYSLIFDFTDSSKNWFSHYLAPRKVLFESMSLNDFMCRFNALDPDVKRNFKPPVVFIDEYHSLYGQKIKLLRNLARILGLPVILASTNADVNNLLNLTLLSRFDNTVWVNVIRALPKANLKSVLHVAGLEPYFVDAENRLDVERVLADHSVDFGNDHELNLFKKLIALMIEQSKTCLPGISVLVFGILKEKLTSIGESSIEAGRLLNTKNIFQGIVSGLNKSLSSRKPDTFKFNAQNQNFGPFYTLSLIFKQDPRIMSAETLTRMMAISVNKHFYYFGNVSDPAIVPLTIDDDGELEWNENPYPVRSYFSHFRDDIFLYMSLFHKVAKRNISICSILSDYCFKVTVANYSVDARSNDFHPQELMVYWSLCNSSHNRPATGPFFFETFLSRFIGNLQLNNLTFQFWPDALLAYMSRIEIPYLLPTGFVNTAVREALGEICRFGRCCRLNNLDQFEIGFQMYLGGVLRTGSVECKYQNDPITAEDLCIYIARAANNPLGNFEKSDPSDPMEPSGLPSPFSVMVTYSLHKSIKDPLSWSGAVQKYFSNRKKIKLDTNQSIADVSVYSIFFDAQSNLVIVPLVEYNNPRSVFVVVQTNFKAPQV